MANDSKANSQRDKKEKLIWALVVYSGLIKQTHMKSKVNVAPSSVGNWKKEYSFELQLLDGAIDLLINKDNVG